MATEPNTPQPLIPFKMPHLTPVLDAPSPLVPESAAFMNFQVFQTEKANLEFMPVKFRTPEHRARLVIVKAQCEELEKQVVLERMVAQIVQMRQEIKELKARLRKHGSKQGRVGPRTRMQHKADRAAIAAKQAELSKLEAAQAQLSGIPTVAELHELTRNQFLKMVGMSVLAMAVWNEAAASDNGAFRAGIGSSWWWCSGSNLGASAGSMSSDMVGAAAVAVNTWYPNKSSPEIWTHADIMLKQNTDWWCAFAVAISILLLYQPTKLTDDQLQRLQCALAGKKFVRSCCKGTTPHEEALSVPHNVQKPGSSPPQINSEGCWTGIIYGSPMLLTLGLPAYQEFEDLLGYAGGIWNGMTCLSRFPDWSVIQAQFPITDPPSIQHPIFVVTESTGKLINTKHCIAIWGCSSVTTGGTTTNTINVEDPWCGPSTQTYGAGTPPVPPTNYAAPTGYPDHSGVVVACFLTKYPP